ncbi:MAG: 7-carboxy-7-deazaguanine synthase QueE, partial [Pseudomonadota bacterium]
FDEVLDNVREHRARYVTVTGGEPLAQPACWPLLSKLCDEDYAVSLETSGAISIANVDHRVSIVMDLKTPSSGEVGRNDYGNIELLKADDQVKFVIADRQDFDWALFKLEQFGLNERVSEVLFSPVFENLAPAELAAWVLDKHLPVRVQVQLHKILWGDKPGV